MESKPKEELIRVTWFEGKLALDLTGKAKGRGVYFCKDPACMEKAMKKGAFARSLHEDPGRPQIERVIEELEAVIRAEQGDGAAAAEGDDHAE